MSNLAGWLSLAVCMHRLDAELIAHLHPPYIEIFPDDCVFPFTYNDVVYYNCISVYSDFDWCSLDKIFQGRWRYCKASETNSLTIAPRKALF
ncbi:binder of sperm protein homolog 2-like [Microcebus murinus]|uniref:binder of sperm protein homolog 2-like n=1 Tax=Microcebus murinus TaxID=30608 RepID=UPI003F6D793E